MKKLIYFGLIKKLIIIAFLFVSASKAEGTYSGVYFTDYEENATIYLCNYYPYRDLNNIINNSTATNNLLNARYNSLFQSVSDIDAVSNIGPKRLFNLKQASHLIDWNVYTDDFGMTLHQTNFIYALTGALIGFVFLFFSIFVIVQKVFL